MPVHLLLLMHWILVKRLKQAVSKRERERKGYFRIYQSVQKKNKKSHHAESSCFPVRLLTQIETGLVLLKQTTPY